MVAIEEPTMGRFSVEVELANQEDLFRAKVGLIAAEQEYCSDYCKSADEWEPCQCGHALCIPESLEQST